ncbi:hypothetical protein JTE90_021075 [Oedothorax gibbosus]|uniref:Uncharacterized protein n=1 Tax=Oedothorax gibbosus TaxID=931172 RepID=A0AAV6VS27_9ARAC|nr:hypothetical protein JTE90_021075 [Oedothorax gibbosus]
MWFFVVLLLYANGINGEDVCETNPSSLCDLHDQPLPENVEEFKEYFRVLLEYIDCLKNYEEKCDGKPGVKQVFHKEEYESIRSLIVDISTEGTPLSSVVFENFHCLRYRFTSYYPECEGFKETIETAYRDRNVTSFSKAKYGEPSKKEMCLNYLSVMGCLVNTSTKRCGAAVKEPVIDIIIRTYFIQNMCSVQDIHELRRDLEDFQLDDPNKAALRESFRQFKYYNFRGISKGDDICKERYPRSLCDVTMPPLPEKKEEFKEYCRVNLEYYDCLKNYEDTCTGKPGVEQVFQEREYDSIRGLVVEISTDGTPLNSVVFENFSCLKNRVKHLFYECRGFMEEIENAEKEMNYAPSKKRCLLNLSAVSCFVQTSVNWCGVAVKDPVINIIIRTYFLQNSCRLQDIHELTNKIEELPLDNSTKSVLRESFQQFMWNAK